MQHRSLVAEPLESRCLLAASVGWDGPGLGSANLTYTISNAPSSLSQAQVDQAIQTAFDAWSDVVDITFTETNQTGLRDSIDISFRQLDGSGGTLAQAYFPDDVNPARIAGDIQFDLSESWEVGNGQGNRAFDLTWVAVHEIGHALGLNHSHEPGSVLRASVSPNQQFTSLDSEDVDDIRQLYAAADQVAPPTETNPETTVQEPTDDPVVQSPTNDNPTTTNNRFTRWWSWFRSGNWWRWFGRAQGDTPTSNSLPPIVIPPAFAQANDDPGNESSDDRIDVTESLTRQKVGPSKAAGFDLANISPRDTDHDSEGYDQTAEKPGIDLLRIQLDRIFAEFGQNVERC